MIIPATPPQTDDIQVGQRNNGRQNAVDVLSSIQAPSLPSKCLEENTAYTPHISRLVIIK